MIHKYRLRDHNIVLDVGSGSVHVVDDLTFQLLNDLTDADSVLSETLKQALLEEYTLEEIEETCQEISALAEQGRLFTSTDYSHHFSSMTDAPIKSMCLHVAHDCNLRCKYCFASTGDFEKTRCLMPLEVGKKSIDFLLTHSGKRKNLELDFFGGEPLMNFDVVKEVVKYARSKEEEYGKKFRFTITTNGMLLDDDKIDFINKEMYNVVLSLDGRKEVNDRMRPRVGGQGSFDVIVPKYQKLVEERGEGQHYLRGTFTRENLDFTEDVLEMYNLGFKQLSVEPVVGGEDEPYALCEEDIPVVCDEYERLADAILEINAAKKKVNFFHFMIDLTGGPCAIKRLRGCGCGNEYVAVTPEGDIYPCHQFVGMDEWKMGSVLDDSLDLSMKDTFAKTSIYSREGCTDCWAQFYCSGGCSANSVKYCGSLNVPYETSCILEKKRVECAIMIQVEEALKRQTVKTK